LVRAVPNMTKPANDEAYIIFVAFSMPMNIFWRKEYASNTKTLITPKNDLNTQMRDERVLMQGYIKRNKKRQSPKKLSKSIHMQGILPTVGPAKDKVFKRSCHGECCLKKEKSLVHSLIYVSALADLIPVNARVHVS
jgi:hypothetical protein